MPPGLFSVPSHFKHLESLLNSDVDQQKRLMSDPIDFFKSTDIDLSNEKTELMNKFALFVREKVPIADPVTMIYE